MASPKSNLAIRFFFVSILTLITSFLYGQAGKDGVKTITTSNTVVNDYTFLIYNAAAGTDIIGVNNNSLSNGFGAPLAAGDLIFIIQVQGATMNSNDDPSYGTVTSYNSCGFSEYSEVKAVNGSNTIYLSCPLQHDYSPSGRVEIIRVPRYSTLTINGNSNIGCPVWDGTTGGVIAIEVQGGISIHANGSIDASGKGFRGGGVFDNNAAYGVLKWRWNVNDAGGEKGESIGGLIADYDALGGRYCKGAPANGGGGGNSHNAGGGGGANAGNISSYTGNGNPDISNGSWAAAWNLEAAGFASSTSSGGGKGGYTFSSSNQNALTLGPFNSAWGGDQRRNNGGLGGHPLDYSTGRIFMGGGGGSGDQNDSKGGYGSPGGGIISVVCYSTISGVGQISSNGNNGLNSLTSNGTDGAGGAGGGGTILLNATSGVSGITCNANGGNGGSQSLQIFNNEAEGPGGGGGGGYIAISSGSVSCNTNGGTNGTTNGISLQEFPPNGATKGGAGINNATLNNFSIQTQTVSLCASSSTTLSFTTTGTPPAGATYLWYDQATGGNILTTGSTYTTPVLTSSQIYYIAACPGTIRVPIHVNINNNLTASFNSNVVCSGTSTNFTATGTAGITSWSWNFGDGSPAVNQQNPTHLYSTSGTYQVVLTVSDGSCTSTTTQNATVSAGPTVNFTSTASTSGCGPLTVVFSNSSTNASGYSWNFGDGSAAVTQTNPTHTYSTPGSYNVILTGSGAGCSSTHSLAVSVHPAPLASFHPTTSICQNDTVHFTNQTITNGSVITSWSWNFGDGSPTSTSQNPNHIYTGAGIFNVRLTANTANCTDDTLITITVSAAPVAHFTTPVSSGCNPLNIAFTNTTTGNATYNWNFGDGSTHATLTNPSHIYSTAGNYSITLIASVGSCIDSFSVPNMIHVSNTPLSSFSSFNAICLGDSLHFLNSSNGNGTPITSNSWNFGDGSPVSTQTNPVHAYSASGTYIVRLTVSNGTCSDDSTLTINVSPGPVAGFSIPTTTGCGILAASFTNTTTGSASYSWSFGDGSPLSTSASPTHNYTTAGTYSVTLIASQGSCSDTIQQTNLIHVISSPLSSFSAPNICLGDGITFTNLSNGNGNTIITNAWTFGDGDTSSMTSPTHFYANPGTFNVQLHVATSSCSDDSTISIIVNPTPLVNFSSNISMGCDSATVQFTNTSTGANSYFWSFGDGDTSIAAAPSHTYTSPGTYTVVLTGSTTAGCNNTRAKIGVITIHSIPTATIVPSLTNICENQCITFSCNCSVDVNSWSWSFSGANPLTSSNQNPGNICYSQNANYNVRLIVTNGFCSDTITNTSLIHVADCSSVPVANFISSDTVFCNNSCIDFVDLTTNAITWNWLFPGGNPSSSTLENPGNICYANPGSYNVTLIAGNTAGNDTLSYNNLIQISTPPTTPSVSLNGNVLSSTTASQYQWYFNNVPLSAATSQQYTALLTGNYSVVITDAQGCTSSSSQTFVSIVGIEEYESNLLFYVYPNPANDNVSVILHSAIPMKLSFTFYDAIGRMLFYNTFESNSNEQTFNYNLKDLAQGIYFLEIKSKDHKWIRTVFKQ